MIILYMKCIILVHYTSCAYDGDKPSHLCCILNWCYIPGTYQPSAGNDTCIDCPAGHECTASVATECTAGSISSLGQMTCTSCPQGNITLYADGFRVIV